MEIKEVIEKKKELEREILLKVMDFEKKTDCEIFDIFLERYQVMGKRNEVYSCSLEVKL